MLQFYSGIFIFGYYSQLCFAQSAVGDQAAQQLIKQVSTIQTSNITITGQTRATLFYTTRADATTSFLGVTTDQNDLMQVSILWNDHPERFAKMPDDFYPLYSNQQDNKYLFQMSLDANNNPNKMVCLHHPKSQVGLDANGQSASSDTADGSTMAIFPIKVGSNAAGDLYVIGNNIQNAGTTQCLGNLHLTQNQAPTMQADNVGEGCLQFNVMTSPYVA